GQRYPVQIPFEQASQDYVQHPVGEVAAYQGDEVEVSLIDVAHARSGDKGNHSNIGVIARKAEYLPWIRASLTEANVAAYMQHVLDPEKSKVIRYELPE
nr:terpene utilization protein AtuA [Acinetobacter pittii]